ncbi:MFS general substrate transporter [Fomitiporia mediterranea MF3/22]|uniref:MFS general substrate transporter n=1 Tax=Fomitiporia mediterranea (strain MF3/22) TaxID=694068 RepID=UPI0004409194|nr:MFS general substrate transporter [Fomitiporia mediterranea MF3/22]EJC99340.1 MFS general substrate transporter [Fomitiporia mediterranea MF3/22]
MSVLCASPPYVQEEDKVIKCRQPINGLSLANTAASSSSRNPALSSTYLIPAFSTSMDSTGKDITTEQIIVPVDDKQDGNSTAGTADIPKPEIRPQYRVYKCRYAGMLGVIVLNIVAAMALTWFGPIANKTTQSFGITLNQVNWLGNVVNFIYIVFSPLVPSTCSRVGIRGASTVDTAQYAIGAGFLVVSAWVRFAGTAHSLNSQGAYALLIIGQLLGAIPQIIFQIIFQVLVPKFSETWFDLKGRTTATMLMTIANPIGNGLGQLISPNFSDTRTSILVLGIISTAVAPFCLMVGSKPPTPPSYSGSKPSQHILTTVRAIFGLLPHPSQCGSIPLHDISSSSTPKGGDHRWNLGGLIPRTFTGKNDASEIVPTRIGERTNDGLQRGGGGEIETGTDVDAYMSLRERIDFIILVLIFSTVTSGVVGFSILSSQILAPHGYSDNTAGLMGTALLFSGVLAAMVTSPLFDHVFTHHLGLCIRICAPIVGAGWLSLIWAVRPGNTGALYAILAVIGVFSTTMLPIMLELGCELTRSGDAASAILWTSANLSTIIFIEVQSALRAPPTASPPSNMHRALIYNGASIFGSAGFALFLRGRQKRREMDMLAASAAATTVPAV